MYGVVRKERWGEFGIKTVFVIEVKVCLRGKRTETFQEFQKIDAGTVYTRGVKIGGLNGKSHKFYLFFRNRNPRRASRHRIQPMMIGGNLMSERRTSVPPQRPRRARKMKKKERCGV
jgi:hypothetical protein